MKNKILSLLLTAILLVGSASLLIACGDKVDKSDETTAADSGAPADSGTAEDSKDVIDYTFDFNGSDFKYTGTPEHETSGTSLIFKKSGTYKLSGTLSDGTIVVDIPKEERLTLLLDNFTASCSTSAVIYVKSADRVYIDLKKGTVNTLTDASSYVYETAGETKPNACIYAADDLTIKGGGTLIVNANYNNGIGCKNDIVIKNGTVTVKAINNAIKGNNSVTVQGDAQVNILACEDAIKSDSLKTGKGFILITEDAVVNLTADSDGLQASQSVTVSGNAKITYAVGGEAVKCDGTSSIADGSMTPVAK